MRIFSIDRRHRKSPRIPIELECLVVLFAWTLATWRVLSCACFQCSLRRRRAQNRMKYSIRASRCGHHRSTLAP